MVQKKGKKEVSVGKSIGILFLYLFLWFFILTVIQIALSLSETSVLYQVISFLKVGVPILVVIFGCPIILIVGINKKIQNENKK